MTADHSISRVRRVSISEPRETVAIAIDALEALLSEPGASPELTVPFQVESPALDDLLLRLIRDIVAISLEEHRPVVAIDPGGSVRTDDAIRAWGTVTLGAVYGISATPGTVSGRIEGAELVLEREGIAR